jgi:hypothetical protein
LGDGTSWSDAGLLELGQGERLTAAAVANLSQNTTLEMMLAVQLFSAGEWSARVDCVVQDLQHDYETTTVLRLTGTEYVTSLTTRDLTGNGVLDVVALTSEGRLAVVLRKQGVENSTPIISEPSLWRLGCSGSHVEIGDLDGDGRDEIVATFAGESSPYTLERECPSGGGVEVWSVIVE